MIDKKKRKEEGEEGAEIGHLSGTNTCLPGHAKTVQMYKWEETRA